MAIEFPCSVCGKMMRAPDSTAGRKARCPLCGGLQTIPASTGTDDIFPSVGPSEADPGLAPLAAQAPAPAPSAAESGLPVPDPGRLAGDCLKAIRYGLSNLRSLFVLVIYAIGLSVILRLITGVVSPLLSFTAVGRLILGVIVFGTNLVMGGFFLRFFLDAVIGSLEGTDQAPDVPDFDLRAHFIGGLKGLGILVVYVFPIVTIPLLPLGLLALGYSDDARAFNLPWAWRAAAKRPAQLLILWPILLLWAAVMFVTVLLLWMGLVAASAALAAGGIMGFLVALLVFLAGTAVIAAVAAMFMTVLFRCVGMLGRHNPVLTDMLPEEDQPLQTAGSIILGLALSCVMVYFVVAPELLALARRLEQ